MPRFPRRGLRACLLAALLPFTVRLLMYLFAGPPAPVLHDEFSYLLAADTFAHGRLANPPHPMAHYFETYHEIMWPAYASKYPPAQGLFLALGQVLFGHPWFGVLISFSLMTAAFCWMLQAWAPGWAAWLVAAAAGFHWALAPLPHGAGGHWMTSYWGGAVAAGAGALVIGAARRLERGAHIAPAVALGVGSSVLALSRPLEGFLLVALTFAWLARRRWRALWPAAVIGAAALVFIGVYNKAVTGSATTFPYMVHEARYAQAPGFWLLPAAPPKTYSYPDFKRFWEEVDLVTYREVRGLPVVIPIRMALTLVPSWVAVAWLLPLAFGWRVLRHRYLKLILPASLALWLLMKVALFHYTAPVIGVVLIVLAYGVRTMRVLLRRHRFVPRLLFGVFLAGTLLQAFAARGIGKPDLPFAVDRRAVLAELARHPGQHLVLVRYAPDHDTLFEWVYNAADIDGAPIVWARDNGPDGNGPLLEYFRGRTVWLLEPDAHPLRLTRR